MKTRVLQEWAALRGRERKLFDAMNVDAVLRARAAKTIADSDAVAPAIKEKFAAINPNNFVAWLELLLKYLPQLLAILIPLLTKK